MNSMCQHIKRSCRFCKIVGYGIFDLLCLDVVLGAGVGGVSSLPEGWILAYGLFGQMQSHGPILDF